MVQDGDLLYAGLEGVHGGGSDFPSLNCPQQSKREMETVALGGRSGAICYIILTHAIKAIGEMILTLWTLLVPLWRIGKAIVMCSMVLYKRRKFPCDYFDRHCEAVTLTRRYIRHDLIIQVSESGRDGRGTTTGSRPDSDAG